MESFLIAFNAVVPFFCYIFFGYIVRISGIMDEKGLEKLNHMIFQAFFPIMMFYNLYHKEDGIIINPKVILTGIISVIGLTAFMFLLIPRLVEDNKKRGVLIQAVSRSNFLLFAVPLIESIYGREGVMLASIMAAFITPLYNILSILVLEYFRGQRLGMRTLSKKIFSNPLIAGAIIGAIFMQFNISLPMCIEKPISQFSAMTTPLALFVLGGTIRITSVKGNLKYIIPALVAKLVIIPSVFLVILQVLNFTSLEKFAIFAIFATPVAAASGTMAANMDGDAELAGELVVVSTIVSVITIFLWIFIMESTGQI